MRVLDWILDRCEGNVEAQETAIGYLPFAKDINIEGADVSAETLEQLLVVDKARWAAEAEEITAYYAENFGDKMPKEIMENLEILKKNCAN
jgi:phosphoenolpyruvate carboxykinase (GTP)